MNNLPDTVLIRIVFNQAVSNDVDLGSLSLSCENRSYIWDITDSATLNNEKYCNAEIDQETFPDCDYDLEPQDLTNHKLQAFLYIRSYEEIKHITAFLTLNGCTRAIDVKQEF